jgi:hypothetical protein
MIRIFKLVLLLVVSQVAFGQAPTNYININGRYRWIAGMFDSTFHIPKGTAASLRTGGSTNAGALFYNTTDSSVYTYTGTQWIKLRGVIIDTTSLSNRINLKLNISDTASMLSPYARTNAVNAGLALKVNISDTASMLTPYLRKVDTASLSNRINLKLNISDTASMLSPYARTNAVNAGLALKVNISDTSSMLLPYLRKIDTASLSNRINLKVNISDTASMLSPYLRSNVASATYVPQSRTITINGTSQDLSANRTFSVGTVTSVGLTAGTGISVSGSPVTGSGSMTVTNTAPDQTVVLNSGTGISISGTYPSFTITNSSPSSGGTVTSVGTNNGTGLTGGTITTAGTLAIDTALISTRLWRQKGIDSVQSNLTAGLALKVNISDTSSMLSPYLRKIDTTAMLSPYARKNFINAGTGISYSSSTGTIANTAPDQTVALTGGTGISISGTYPNFTITNSSPSGGGTVTSVGSGTGLTGGPITTSGTLAVDTLLMSTRAWRQKGIDSVQANLTAGLSLKLNISDTANMLSPYLRKVDTTSLSNRINLKLNISDTSSMLTNYFRINGVGLNRAGQTVLADTLLLSTRAWRQKGIDSVASLITSGYVPYTGATTNVDLGTHTLTAKNLVINHASGSGVAASITKGGNGEALTISKTSGSGNAMSVSGGLTSLVNLSLSSISNATTDTDRFLVSDGGVVKYRTGAEVLSDIGGQAALTNPVTGTGTTNRLAKFTASGTIGNGSIADSSSSVAMTISSGGNLGLGVTPSAWGLGKAIEIGNIGNAIWGVNATQYNIIQNAYYDNGYKYASSNAASYYQQSGGNHTWYNAPAGTAGNAISFTGAMTLIASGNLGLGTATIGSKLQVNGNAAIGYSASTAAPTNGLAVAGNLGVGTNTPEEIITAKKAGTLYLYLQNTTNGVQAYFGPQTSDIYFGAASNHSVGFFTNGIERARLLAGGGLIIGNGETAASPSTGIISGTGGTGTNIAGAEFRIRGGASTGNAAGGPITFYTSAAGSSGTGVNAATERMRLDTRGNLGLGVTPSAWFASSKALQIGSTLAPYLALFQQTASTADGYLGWGAYLTGDRTFAYTTTGDAVSLYRLNSGNHVWFNAPSGTAGNAITFTQAMTLNASGNLGIGTTSPTQKLQIAAGNIQLDDDYAVQWGGATNFILGSNASNYLRFYTNNTERMRITSAGNVGIGTTNPAVKLDVNGDVRTTSKYAWGTATNGTTGQIATDNTNNYFDYLGALIFRTAAASSEKMRLDASGNLGIGTTSPNSLLHVAGSLRLPIAIKTATYTLDASDYTVVFDLNGNATANLPDATTIPGRIYVIKINRTSVTDTLTIDPNGAQTIDGNATLDLLCQQAITIQSDGTNWRVIGDYLGGLNCL